MAVLLALGEYGGLWAYAAAGYDLRDPAYVSQSGPYSPVDLSTRLILIGIATILAATIVRRAQQLLYLASHDRLTGLFNRGHFDRALGGAMESAARGGQPLSLAILIETLRREIAATPIDLGDGRTLRVDFSAGLAGTPADAEVTSPKVAADLRRCTTPCRQAGRPGTLHRARGASVCAAAPRDGGPAVLLLGRLSGQPLEQSLHQVLPLHHEMPERMLLRPRRFPLQRRQIVGQQITQKDCLIV